MNVTKVDSPCNNLEEPAGKTCLEMRFSENERSLENVQDESRNPCQVVVLGKIHAEIHGCSLSFSEEEWKNTTVYK